MNVAKITFAACCLIAATARAETNLEVAWKACVNSASGMSPPGDFEISDYYANFIWAEAIRSGCEQIQAEVASRAKAAAEAWFEKLEREQKIKDAEQAARVLPIIRRALSDPDGISPNKD